MLQSCEAACHSVGKAVPNMETYLTPLEAQPIKQVATNVVTRLLHHSDSRFVTLPTGGQLK